MEQHPQIRQELAPASRSDILLQVRDLRTHFRLDEGMLKAVDGISFNVHRHRVLGMVGESGCGKSVTAQSILQIVPKPGIVTGEMLWYRGDQAIDIGSLDPEGEEMRSIRGNEIAMIFQEPMTAFSPVHTVGNQLMEAYFVHGKEDPVAARARAVELLDMVGIPAAERRVDEYTFQLSGGMRQRAMIAMAISCDPALLIADEPSTALDVTIQAQILDVLRRLQEELGMALILITHDLGVVAEMAHEVVVMYGGQVVEQADVTALFTRPLHPYTRGLLNSVPTLTTDTERLATIEGVVPDPIRFPVGCRFAPRCNYAVESCGQAQILADISAGHMVRCAEWQRIEQRTTYKGEEIP